MEVYQKDQCEILPIKMLTHSILAKKKKGYGKDDVGNVNPYENKCRFPITRLEAYALYTSTPTWNI